MVRGEFSQRASLEFTGYSFLNYYFYRLSSLDDKCVISGGLKCGKRTNKISPKFQEVPVTRDKTGSELRKGSEGKHAKLILWKAYLGILQFGAITCYCTVVRLMQVLRN